MMGLDIVDSLNFSKQRLPFPHTAKVGYVKEVRFRHIKAMLVEHKNSTSNSATEKVSPDLQMSVQIPRGCLSIFSQACLIV